MRIYGNSNLIRFLLIQTHAVCVGVITIETGI